MIFLKTHSIKRPSLERWGWPISYGLLYELKTEIQGLSM
jgi:hypothetical protein